MLAADFVYLCMQIPKAMNKFVGTLWCILLATLYFGWYTFLILGVVAVVSLLLAKYKPEWGDKLFVKQ